MWGKLFFFFLVILITNVSHAFEIEGIKSGMSIDEVTKVLESLSYKKLETKEISRPGFYQSSRDGDHFMYPSFCKGKLVQIQKDLKPSFDYFVILVNENRKIFGKPIDAWTQPKDVLANIESISASFFWKDGPTLIEVRYCEFPSKKQLYIIYSINNSCWKSHY